MGVKDIFRSGREIAGGGWKEVMKWDWGGIDTDWKRKKSQKRIEERRGAGTTWATIHVLAK